MPFSATFCRPSVRAHARPITLNSLAKNEIGEYSRFAQLAELLKGSVMAKSVCFVLMPFGTKADSSGRPIDFDRIYDTIFKPAVNATGLLPVRADEEQAQGFIHKLMYERLLLSEYAIADLTTLNANVYYELGVRHAARPSTTIMTMAGQAGLPFDVAGLRALPYALTPEGVPVDAQGASAALVEQLNSCIASTLVDSPIFQLIEGMQPPPIDRKRTDLFRERIAKLEEIKDHLSAARAGEKIESIDSIAESLGDVSELEAGVVIDLLLSYRAVKGYEKMLELAKGMNPELSKTAAVRELVGFAQNRIGQSREAEETLQRVIDARGPSSEVNGLLGRVYKDRWKKALKAGDTFVADTCLTNAIDTYLEGFETDWRDPYPGVNAVTLMEVADDDRRHELIHAVRYSVKRRLSRKGLADYWDHATNLELAILADDAGASRALGAALSAARVRWELETTAENLQLIADARASRQGSTTIANVALNEFTKRINNWT
jgi:tetratricopeptide (TPR) repeat protein